MKTLAESRAPLVLFDGVCNLCNGVVRFVVRHEKSKTLRFAALQSEAGKVILGEIDLADFDDLSSIVFIEDGLVQFKSDAAIAISSHLHWPYRLGVFKIIPRSIRDIIYNWIARYRYHWFGKTDECMVPTPAMADRFL